MADENDIPASVAAPVQGPPLASSSVALDPNAGPVVTPPAPMSSPVSVPQSAAPNVVQAQQPQAPPQPTPQQMELHHQSLLGKAAQFLMGTQQTYTVDPKTGQTVATPVQQQPGQLFKSLLAGAILGGATGSQSTSGSGLQSAGMGAGAVLQQQQQQDAAKKQQAQQDFKNGQEVNSADQQKILQQAQIAHMQSQDLVNNANLDLSYQDHLDTLNKSYAVRQDAAVAAGGQLAPLLIGGKDVNGQMGNWAAIRDAYMKDPSSVKPPTGYHAVNTQTVDTNGLTQVPGKGWEDKDGNLVDLSDRTAHSIYFVPDDFNSKPMQITGKSLVATGAIPAESVDQTKTYTLPAGQVMALTAIGTKNANEAAETKMAASRTAAQNAASYAEASHSRAETTKLQADTAAAKDDEASVIKGMTAQVPYVDVNNMIGLRTGQREALYKKAMAADPNFKPIDYNNKINLINSAQKGDISDRLVTMDAFLNHTGDLFDGVQDLRNSSLALANTPINKLRNMTGQPGVVPFLTKIDAAKTEFQKILSNGKALTESDKTEGKKLLDENMSPAQLQAQAKQFGHTALIQLGSTNNKYQNTVGQPIPNILSADGRDVVRKLGLSDVATHVLKDTSTLPPQALQSLKDGVNTQFANGQTWTSQNGQPVRLK